MGDSIKWYASKTIWAGILGIAVPAFGMVLHVSVSSAETQELATDLSLIGGAVAGILAIWGRIKASQPITGSKAASKL